MMFYGTKSIVKILLRAIDELQILRMRRREGVYDEVRFFRTNGNITRRTIDHRKYMERLVDTNLEFIKAILNSVQYWADRNKRYNLDNRIFRQTTSFLTIRWNKALWYHLLQMLELTTIVILSSAYSDIYNFISFHIPMQTWTFSRRKKLR